MARTIRDASLQSREARGRLQPGRKPYYRLIEEGLHLGYRKPRGRRGKPAAAGKWVVRRYLGDEKYQLEVIGAADDFSDANGETILSFPQAQVRAREQVKAGPLTVQAAIEDYLAFLEAEGKPTADTRARAKAFICPRLFDKEASNPKLGDEKVDELTPDQLRRWHAELAKAAPRLRTRKGERQKHRDMADGDDARRQRRSSANRVLTILKAALNRAWQDDKVASPAAWQKVKPFKNVDAARPHYLTIAEARRLVNATDPEYRPLVQAALQTGARYGELIRLTVADFKVVEQKRPSGARASVAMVHIAKSKSGLKRDIVLTEEGAAFFRELTAGRAGNELMLRHSNGEPFGTAHQIRPIAEACDRAKISPRISFHSLRHTWASLAVMNGTPLMVVARNLGHADTRMAEKHYAHLAPSYVADVIMESAPRFGFKPDKKIAVLS
jgi:integrase